MSKLPLWLAGALAAVSCAPGTAPRVAGGDPARGRAVIAWYGCGSCHVIPSVANATGLVGPSLLGVAGRSYLAGTLPNTPDNLLRWIRNPRQVNERTVMPDTGVTEEDARHIAAFLYVRAR